jgi:hypothetical protein
MVAVPGVFDEVKTALAIPPVVVLTMVVLPTLPKFVVKVTAVPSITVCPN